MSQAIDEIRAFASHPEVDSMEPVWPLTQAKAREILADWEKLKSELATLLGLAGKVDASNQRIEFGDIKQAARRNGVDAS